MKKFKFRFITSLAVLSLLIFGVASASASSVSSRGHIKIGLLEPLSGAYAKVGGDIRNGFMLAFDQAGDVAGRKVQIIVEDTEMKPDVGITKIRKLVEHDKVHFTAGCFSSAVGLAVRDYADKYHVPHIFNAGTVAIEILTTHKSQWCRHPAFAGASHVYGFPQFLVKELGYKRLIVFAPDYAYGWSELKHIKAASEKAGGAVVQEFLTPFPTLDFSPYLAKLTEADAVYAEYAGADAARFVRQYRQYGIKMSLVGGGTFFPEILKDIGIGAVGAYGAMVWLPILKTPENITFMRTYKEKFGMEPGLHAANSYSSAMACIEVIRKIKGDVEDKRKFLDAWYGVENLKTPLGNFGYEKSTEGGIHSVYIVQIIEEKGLPTYRLLKEIPVVRPSDMLKLMGLWKE